MLVPPNFAAVMRPHGKLYVPSRSKDFRYSGSLKMPPTCSLTCSALTKKGTECKRRCCLDYRYCGQHLRSIVGIKVGPSSVAGKGLFAVKPFRKGQRIAEYYGEHLSKKQFDDRYDDPDDLLTSGYAISLEDGSVIDSLGSRCAASYANDPIDVGALWKSSKSTSDFRHRYNARKKQEPGNAMADEAKGNQLYLVATKAIKSGDEILWPYGASYWSSKQMKEVFST